MPLLSARTVSRRRRLQLFAFFVRPGPAASKRALCGPGQEDGCHQCTRLVLRKCTLRVFRPRFCHNSHSSFLQHTQYETVLDIRRQHDRGFPRWMSHVTFCYPFVERSEFGAYFEKLKSIRCEPFEVVFDKIGHFRQKDGYTVHLAMGEASLRHFRALHQKIVDKCPELRGRRSSFVPHLTLAQCGFSEYERLQRQLTQRLELPICVPFSSLSLISRDGQPEFRVIHEWQVSEAGCKESPVPAEKPAAAQPRVWKRGDRKTPRDAVFVGRPTKWGNPFKMHDEKDRASVCERFEAYMASNPELCADAKRELKGRHLICFCAPRQCHADTLLRIANEP